MRATGITALLLLCLASLATVGTAVGKNGEYKAGPIWNDADAVGKCTATCTAVNLAWTGKWRTTKTNVMSVCSCAAGAARPPAGGGAVSQCSIAATEKCGPCSVTCTNQRASCTPGTEFVAQATCVWQPVCKCQ